MLQLQASLRPLEKLLTSGRTQPRHTSLGDSMTEARLTVRQGCSCLSMSIPTCRLGAAQSTCSFPLEPCEA